MPIYFFDAGNSTKGQIGFCARVEADNLDAALAELNESLSAHENEPDVIRHEGGVDYVAVYFGKITAEHLERVEDKEGNDLPMPEDVGVRKPRTYLTDDKTIQLVADLTTQLRRHDGCSRMGTLDYLILDRALKWTAEQKKAEPRIIRVFVEDGLIETVTGILEGHVVRIIDMDTEGSDESDGAYDLSMDDRPAADDDERSHGPKPVLAFVTDHLPDGTTERPYELETGGDARE